MKIIKKTIALFIAVCCAAVLVSCGDEKNDTSVTESAAALTTEAVTTASETSLTVDEIRSALFDAAKPEQEMTTLTPADSDYAEDFEYLFEITADIAADSSVSYCTSGRLADEIDVFILKDLKDLDTLKSSLSSRAASRSAQYRGYYEKESDKASKALILSKGKYVAFVISDNNNAVKQAFEDLFN